jgi:putative CocE/NonD family hydrolase
MRTAMPRLAGLLTVLLATPLSAQAPQADASAASFRETSQYLMAADGTRIAISVIRPLRDGRVVDTPMPVIVTQDRGQGESERVATARRYFLNRGYVIVAQDRRGTGASFGVQGGFVNAFDAQDAKTVIEWAGAQPFSTGRVVTMGCSNLGAWQYLVATLKPRHLVAIAPACASPQFFDHGVMTNGVPMFPSATAPFDGKCRPDPTTGPVRIAGLTRTTTARC